MKNTRVNRKFFELGLSHTKVAKLISRRCGRKCCRQEVSMVARGQRFTRWIQEEVARVLRENGPDLFSDWWWEERERKRRTHRRRP